MNVGGSRPADRQSEHGNCERGDFWRSRCSERGHGDDQGGASGEGLG
jgi:hypothetical protein